MIGIISKTPFSQGVFFREMRKFFVNFLKKFRKDFRKWCLRLAFFDKLLYNYKYQNDIVWWNAVWCLSENTKFCPKAGFCVLAALFQGCQGSV